MEPGLGLAGLAAVAADARAAAAALDVERLSTAAAALAHWAEHVEAGSAAHAEAELARGELARLRRLCVLLLEAMVASSAASTSVSYQPSGLSPTPSNVGALMHRYG